MTYQSERKATLEVLKKKLKKLKHCCIFFYYFSLVIAIAGIVYVSFFTYLTDKNKFNLFFAIWLGEFSILLIILAIFKLRHYTLSQKALELI
jgi:hypothetical protein